MNEIIDSMLMPFGVAIAGAIIGLLIAWRFLKLEESASLTPLVDLDERIEHLIALLKDLEQQRTRLEPDFYEAEKTRLEQEAAATLAKREQVADQVSQVAANKTRSANPKEIQSKPMGFMESRPGLRGFLWGALAVGTIAGLFMSVQNESSLRAEGGSMTGNSPITEPPAARAQAPGPSSGEIESLIGQLRQDPSNIKAMVRLSRVLLTRQMFGEAEVVVQRALAIEPNNLGALTSQAMITASRGDLDGAKGALVSVLKKDKRYADAWFFRGMLAMQAGQNDEMRAFMTEFVRYAEPSPRRERFVSMLGIDLQTLPEPLEP